MLGPDQEAIAALPDEAPFPDHAAVIDLAAATLHRTRSQQRSRRHRWSRREPVDVFERRAGEERIALLARQELSRHEGRHFAAGNMEGALDAAGAHALLVAVGWVEADVVDASRRVPSRPEEVELPEAKVGHEWPTVVQVGTARVVAGRHGAGDDGSLATARVDDLAPKALLLEQEVPAPAVLDEPVVWLWGIA